MTLRPPIVPRACERALLTLAFAGLLLALLHGTARAVLPVSVADALRTAGIAPADVSLYVQELDAREPLITHHPHRPMVAASVMKLVTTYAALELLGPAFTWKTEVYAGGPQTGDVIDGDLILRGTGDPKLTPENFWLLLRALRSRGVREIRGDLVLDRSYFAPAPYDPGEFDGAPNRPYNVGPDPLLVNFKAIRFRFVPDADHSSVQVLAEPRPAQLAVASSLKLTGGRCGDWRAGIKADFTSGQDAARAEFSGSYPAACGENVWNVSMLSHTQYVWGVFRQLWRELGGTVRGGVRDGQVSPQARLVYTAESPPLGELVRDMNKFSNNVMARQLFLTLSAEALHQPATTADSARVLEGWLAQKGIDLPGLTLENGSGLSRLERISASGLGRLLVSARHSAVMPEFIASMPLVAYDGTMRKRLREDPVAGHAHIKTGSLEGVRSLAGYALDRKGRRFAIVFFVNDPKAAAARGAQDELLRWVYEDALPEDALTAPRPAAATP